MQKNKISLSRMRRLLWLMGVVKIPMIAYVRPKLMFLDEERSQVRIKLKRRTKNHLKSMYFGSLAVGADMAAGLHAFYFARQSGVKVSFAFKAVKAEFLKRAMTDVYFNSDEGQLVKQAFDEALLTKERVNKWVKVEAKNTDGEIVAVFDMEISVKVL
ncbi:DUF4442 domain-containing protein [Brumimicrobium oceani]|uniref:DUF4442 domain-containing protein n=1 Tax=Brumimicrobium oceani TaxID=2100725 RepID=A0A2U2XH49_9FLAO|nr:DUF4442 domain-containing protein [Brumimicrobium oceani]PWH87115.1 DUF4442 domain-containing protein [Brumimicrobium oceani]